MVQGAFRNENGVPLFKVKQLAPSMPGVNAWQQEEWRRRAQVAKDEVNQYQSARKYRPTIARDIMTGCEIKPRKVIPDSMLPFAPRFKKPITIVPEGTAMMEAANDGVIREMDSKKGLEDWDKYKKEIKYKKIIMPED